MSKDFDASVAGLGSTTLPNATSALISSNYDEEYEPTAKRKRGRPKKIVYKVSGVNILNQPLATAEEQAEQLRQRRKSHNLIERRRRDQINGLIGNLADLLPLTLQQGATLNKANVLQSTVCLVRQLTAHNEDLLVERAILRQLLSERGIDWKMVEVAFAKNGDSFRQQIQKQQVEKSLNFEDLKSDFTLNTDTPSPHLEYGISYNQMQASSSLAVSTAPLPPWPYSNPDIFQHTDHSNYKSTPLPCVKTCSLNLPSNSNTSYRNELTGPYPSTHPLHPTRHTLHPTSIHQSHLDQSHSLWNTNTSFMN